MSLSQHVVVQNIQRTDIKILDKLSTCGVATIHDVQGRKGIMRSYMRPIFEKHIAGSAITVSIPPGDNWMLHVALEQCKVGDVLVVAPTAPCEIGCFGGLLGVAAVAKGVRGLIIETGVRDTQELCELNFPVWSKHISPKSCVKESLGSVNIPLLCAGVLVQPGDAIIADNDGVAVVARQQAGQVAILASEREQKEIPTRKRLENKELGLDIYKMREKLKAKGLVYK